jgi:hypothetical protein
MAAAGVEPRHAADARSRYREPQRVYALQRVIECLRTGEHQQGTRRNRRAKLLEQHHDEYSQQLEAGREVADLHAAF